MFYLLLIFSYNSIELNSEQKYFKIIVFFESFGKIFFASFLVEGI